MAINRRALFLALSLCIFANTKCIARQKSQTTVTQTKLSAAGTVLDYSEIGLGRLSLKSVTLNNKDNFINEKIKDISPSILEGIEARLHYDSNSNLQKLAEKYSLGRPSNAVQAQLNLNLADASRPDGISLREILTDFVKEYMNTFPNDDDRNRNCHEAALCALFDQKKQLAAFGEYNLRAYAVEYQLRPLGPGEKIQSGDIISYFDLNGKLVHSVLFVSDEKDNFDLVFSKNGQSRNLPYVLQTRTWIENQVYFKNNEGYQITVLRKSSDRKGSKDSLSLDEPLTKNIYFTKSGNAK